MQKFVEIASKCAAFPIENERILQGPTPTAWFASPSPPQASTVPLLELLLPS